MGNTPKFSIQREVIRLLAIYNDIISEHKANFFTKMTSITNKETWNNFKDEVYSINSYFQQLIERADEHFIMLALPEIEIDNNYISTLASTIKGIEEKYHNQIQKGDLPSIIENIVIIIKYNDIKAAIDSIHKKAQRNQKRRLPIESFQDIEGKIVTALEPEKEELKDLLKKQEENYQEYQNTLEFILGSSKDEENKKKI